MVLLILLLLIFLLLSGFFSASETSLFSLSQMQLRAYATDPNPKKRLVARLIQRPQNLLVTILMGNVAVNILVQNIASSLFEKGEGWGLKVGVPLLLTLIFGELLPKNFALAHNEAFATRIAPPLTLFHRLLAPIRVTITRFTNRLSRIMFALLHKEPDLTKEELLHALRSSQEAGILSVQEANLLRGTIHLQEIRVKKCMRPREEAIIYDLGDPLTKLLACFAEQQCTRVPICEGGLDNLLGILTAYDYLLIRDQIDRAEELKPFLKPAYFVPEGMEGKILLKRFDERDEDLAVVVDEYGMVSGLISREDLVEVVVGEIADPRDEKSHFTKASEGVIIASGRLELAELNSLFDTELSSPHHAVTVGGLLTEALGEIPQAGKRLVTPEFLFHVLASDPNRVRRVYIRHLEGGGQ